MGGGESQVLNKEGQQKPAWRILPAQASHYQLFITSSEGRPRMALALPFLKGML